MTYIDPRGILRTVAKVEEPNGQAFVTFCCGHRGQFAPHFHYRIGDEMRCFRCGQVARGEAVLPNS